MLTIKCKAILFDLDGVLVDSIANIRRHWRSWAGEHGIDPDKIRRTAHGKRAVDTIRTVAPHLDAEKEAARLSDREAIDPGGVVAYDNVRELLHTLPKDVWAVVTSGTRITALARIREAQLPEPEVFVPADEVENGKPHPESFLKAAEYLRVHPRDCIVIEDAPAGIKSARAAGMRVIGVASMISPTDLSGADAVIESMNELDVDVSVTGDSFELTVMIQRDV